MAERQYIVLCGQAICNDQGVGVTYDFDGEWFDARQDAIKHGLEIRGSDDFNIGVVTEGFLTSIDWMSEEVDTDPSLLWAIQQDVIQPSIEAGLEQADA